MQPPDGGARRARGPQVEVRGVVEGEPPSMLKGRQGDQGSLGKGTQGSQTGRGSPGKLVSAWGFTDVDLSVDPGFHCEWKRNS